MDLPFSTKIKTLFLALSSLLIMLGFSHLAFALDPNKALTQYVHEIWQDELPQNTVHAITQTKDGYMWFGTYEGLVRFDGVNFYTFNKYNTQEMKSNSVFSLHTDRQGHLWVGTADGVLFFKDGKFSRYDIKNGLISNITRSIFEDGEGNIWIGTEEGLSCIKDGKFIDTLIAKTLLNTRVNAITQDKFDYFWFATGKGLVSLKGDKITFYTTRDGLSSNIITSLAEDDSSNDLWVGTDKGLDYFREGSFSNYSFGEPLYGKQIDTIMEDKQGNLWFGTLNEGLWRIKNNNADNFTSKEGLSQNNVRSIYEDIEGNLWIGTNSGLNRFRDSIFTNYTTREGLSNNSVRTVYGDSLGGFWIGTDGGGLNYLKNGKVSVYTAKDGLSNDFIRTISQDSKGNLWVGTTVGLTLFKNGKFTHYLKDILPVTLINAIFIDGENIWVGTYSNGLYLINNNKVTLYTDKEGLNNNFIRSIYVDKNKRVWVGTRSGFNLLKDGKIISYQHHPIDQSTAFSVFTFYEDNEGRIWIGTDKGLLWFREGKLYACTAKEGLFDDVVFQILESKGEAFWISCNKGIYKVQKKDLITYEKGLIKSISCIFYNKSDGMTTNQCNGATQPAGWKDTKGRLWFATIKGLTMVDPESVKINKLPPPVTIEKVVVNGESLNLAEKPLLDSHKKDFEFYYNALSFIAPKKVRFKYKLEGYDKDWKEIAERKANYTNIAPGDYNFRVIACNNDGVWNEVGASYSFHINTPFSQTWGAYFFYLTGTGAVTYIVFLVRVQALRRRNRLLEDKVESRTLELNNKNDELAEKIDELNDLVKLIKLSEASALEAKSAAIESEKTALHANQAKSVFFSNMSHELRTPLNAILGFAQLMEKDKTLNNKQIENLKIILRSGEHLLALINDVLSLAKIEAGKFSLNRQPFNFYQLLQNIEEMIRIKADSKGLELVFELGNNLPESVLGDEGKLRQILINLLGNAVKFTDKGRVKLKVNWKDDIASFDVEDTGQGISEGEIGNLFQAFAQTQSGHKSKEGTGLGLVLSKNFINLMDGEITLKSQLNKGTTFSFYIKLPKSRETKNLTKERKVISLLPNQPTYKILIADDEVETRKLLVELLQPLGFELNEAKNGKEAIELWSSWHPNLIWMDMRMPVMDGYLATNHIRKIEELEENNRHSKTVIIALTASALEHEQKSITEKGCDDFIAKPFYESSIFDKLTQHLGVKFQYEEDLGKLNNNGSSYSLTTSRFRIVPKELLKELTHSLNIGDNQAAENVIEQIAKLDKEFANEIDKMVKNFQFDELLEILEGTTT